MVARAEKYWTYEDLLALPDSGKRYEIIEGVLYEMPAPNRAHGRVIINLILYVCGPILAELGAHLYTAPMDVFLGDTAPVRPDLFLLLPDQLHLESDRGIEGSPALMGEVLSPSNPEPERITKRAHYARAGVPEYWIVSPEAAIVEILVLDGDRYRTLARVGGDEPIPSTVLPELRALASDVFRQ